MPGEFDKFLKTAKDIGNPQDQIENFLAVGYVPQPAQLRFHAAARMADNEDGPDQILFGGARGGGKSHAVMEQLAADDCQRYPGLKALYLRKAAKQAKEQFEDLRRTVLVDIPHVYKSGSGVVEFPNGSRIMIGHFRDEKDVDAYLGIEYDIIACEELTTLSQTKYQALRDSTRSSKPNFRPRCYNSTNPGSIGHSWVKRRFVKPFKDGEEVWTRYIPATIDDNAFIDEGYRRKIEENTGWRKRAYRYGDWDIAVGQFFTTWREDMHVIDPFDIRGMATNGWPVWASMDYGYTHPTVFMLHMQDPDTYDRITIAEYGRSRTLPGTHARNVRQMLNKMGLTVPMVHPWVAGRDIFARRGDSSGLTVAEQYATLGIYFEAADMDRINGWATCLESLGDFESNPVLDPSWQVFRTCTHLIEQIPSMIHNPKVAEDVLKVDVGEDGQGGDDYVDAWRYGMMAGGVGSNVSSLIAAPDAIIEYDSSPWATVTEYDNAPWGGYEI